MLTKHGWARVFAASLAFLSASQIGNAQDDSKAAKQRTEIDTESKEALDSFLKLDGAKALYDKAAGYAVFRVTKAGLGASGAGGDGVAVNKASSARTYMRMGAAGVGLTFGVNRYDVVILFETAAKLDAFMKGGWDSSATAQAAAGSKGTEVGATFFEGVAYYQIERKGIMASADVSGTRFWVAEELN